MGDAAPAGKKEGVEATGRREILNGAEVSIHYPDTDGKSAEMHLDVSHPILGKIILKGEHSFAGSAEGGIFVSLRPKMAERVEKALKESGNP
jgi:hypothetical protein